VEDHDWCEKESLLDKWSVVDILHPDPRELTSCAGQFPGPWIEARSGDDIEVDIYNGLTDEGIAIHWHGLWMRGKTPFKTY
jgi:FtsP/CotA-like multicopper oxidase with cupredoxin domain